MGTVAVDQFIVDLDEGQQAVIAEAAEARRFLRARLAEGDNLRTRIALRSSGDVEGHAASGDTVAVTLEVEGDTEGHALSLRFPTPQAARDFEKRMLATGLLVGTIAVGAIGIGLGQGIHPTAGQVVQPAQVAPAAAPHDMDKYLAPAAAPHDTDKDLSGPRRSAPGSTQRMIRD